MRLERFARVRLLSYAKLILRKKKKTVLQSKLRKAFATSIVFASASATMYVGIGLKSGAQGGSEGRLLLHGTGIAINAETSALL